MAIGDERYLCGPRNCASVTMAMMYGAWLALLPAPGVASRRVLRPPQMPPGPGRDLLLRACSSCHSAETVIQHVDTAAGWADEVGSMVARGAMLSSAEVSQVVAYLAQNYPSGAPAQLRPHQDQWPAVRRSCRGRDGGRLSSSLPIAPPGLSPTSKPVTPSAPNSPTAGRSGLACHESRSSSHRFSPLTQITRKTSRVEGSLDLGKQSQRTPDEVEHG